VVCCIRTGYVRGACPTLGVLIRLARLRPELVSSASMSLSDSQDPFVTAGSSRAFARGSHAG
jgi:hypothetical protein